jgi:hypothetical protein
LGALRIGRVAGDGGLGALANTGRIKRILVGLTLVVPAACGGEVDPPSEPMGTPTGPASPSVPVEGQPPTTDNIRGIWQHATQPTRMIRFGPDQAFAVDTHGSIDSSPALVATYELDGRDIVVTVTQVGAPCDVGDTWTWRAGVPEDGRLQLVFTETGRGQCAIPIGTEWLFIRLSPRSSAGADITAGPVGGFAPLPANSDEALEVLDGLWLLESGGHLLRLRPYGTYAIDDMGLLGSDPYDAGAIEVEGTTLTLVSGAGSKRCAEGDRLVLRSVRIDEIGRSLRGTVVQDDCSHATGTRPTWIRLSL